MPYVFNAKGRVHLSPPPLPRPIFSKLDVTKTLSPPKRVLRSTKPTPALTVTAKQELTDTDADGDTDIEVDTNKAFNFSHPFYQSGKPGLEHGNVLVEDSDLEGQEEDEDEQEDVTLEDPNAELDPDKWNEPAHAFGNYLLKYMGHPASDIDLVIEDDKLVIDPFDIDDDDIVSQDNESPEKQGTEEDEFDEDEEALKLELLLSSSPGLTHRYSSSSSSQAPSSPFPPTSSPSRDFLFRSSSSTPSLAGSIFPDVEAFDLEQHYPNTKYTYTPAPPKERTHRRRIERVQKRMEKMKRQAWLCARDESVSPDEEQKNEVDQLAGDDGRDDKEEKWVKPILKEGEVWDPFGDELEV